MGTTSGTTGTSYSAPLRKFSEISVEELPEVLAVAKDSLNPMPDLEAWMQIWEAVTEESKKRQRQRDEWDGKLAGEYALKRRKRGRLGYMEGGGRSYMMLKVISDVAFPFHSAVIQSRLSPSRTAESVLAVSHGPFPAIGGIRAQDPRAGKADIQARDCHFSRRD